MNHHNDRVHTGFQEPRPGRVLIPVPRTLPTTRVFRNWRGFFGFSGIQLYVYRGFRNRSRGFRNHFRVIRNEKTGYREPKLSGFQEPKLRVFRNQTA